MLGGTLNGFQRMEGIDYLGLLVGLVFGTQVFF